MAYATDGTIGPNVALTHTTAQFKVGTRVTGTDGTSFVYCSAAEAITQYAGVAITSGWAASQITPTNCALARTIGVAQVAVASGSFFWCAIDGANLLALVDGTGDVNPGQTLTVSNIAAGLFAINSVSSQQVMAGLRSNQTVSTTTATCEVVLNHPHIVLNRI